MSLGRSITVVALFLTIMLSALAITSPASAGLNLPGGGKDAVYCDEYDIPLAGKFSICYIPRPASALR